MDALELAARISDPEGTGFALATVDEKTGAWFLMRGCSLGNPMRTRGQTSVMIWREKSMVYDWLGNLPDRTKKEMEDRSLFIVPVKLSVSPDVEQFELIEIISRQVPSEEIDAPPKTEFELRPTPIKRRRGGRKRR